MRNIQDSASGIRRRSDELLPLGCDHNAEQKKKQSETL